MSRLVKTIKARLNELGPEKTKRVFREFVNYPFVDGNPDYPRLYAMVMSELELQNQAVVQETQTVITIHEDDEDETADTASSAEQTMTILNNLGQYNASTNPPDHGIDLQLLNNKAIDELGAIKGKKPMSVPPRTHNEKKQKLLNDAIKIGEKRARRSDEDDGYDQEKTIPGALKQMMAREKGNEAVLVIQKKLSQADVDPHNECLSLPISQLDSSFLSQIEREFLLQGPQEEEGEKMARIEAKLVEPSGSVSEIYLTRWWNMEGGEFLNLVANWKDLVERNRLREGIEVQIWCFRGAGSQQLWLALFTELGGLFVLR